MSAIKDCELVEKASSTARNANMPLSSFLEAIIANLWTDAWYNQKKHMGQVSNQEALRLLREEIGGNQTLVSRAYCRGLMSPCRF